MRLPVLGVQLPFGDDAKVLEADRGDGCTALCMGSTPLNSVLSVGHKGACCVMGISPQNHNSNLPDPEARMPSAILRFCSLPRPTSAIPGAHGPPRPAAPLPGPRCSRGPEAPPSTARQGRLLYLTVLLS